MAVSAVTPATQMDPPIRRALISVSDKTGLEPFASGLVAKGVEIYSTGGTRKYLEDRSIPVIDVSQYTEFPEMMDGRVKTLHPKIFAGILCRHDREDDTKSMQDHGILSFELVVVNLYPFQETIAKEDVTTAQATEQIDIGGPSLVRAAAKNNAFTTICTSPEQYEEVLAEIQKEGRTSGQLRRRLMVQAFAHTAQYDAAISTYFQQQVSESPLPDNLHLNLTKQAELRYGENPHQSAAVYQTIGDHGPSIISATQHNGKGLSYNNILDLDAALTMVRLLPDPSVVVLKHNNPCGASSAQSIAMATRHAMEGDPISAFGSILGFNRTLDVESAEYLTTPGLFVEAIVAPDFEPEALEILMTRPKWKSNVRLMSVGSWSSITPTPQVRFIQGGLLVQQTDVLPLQPEQWQTVTQAKVDDSLMSELIFGWAMVRQVKSNAITLSKDRTLIGVGAGQMSRVDSVKISIEKAGPRAKGSVMSSDAFFPFPDSIEQAAQAGIVAIIQPGGSRRDDEVIAACNQFNIPMVFTGNRHFKH